MSSMYLVLAGVITSCGLLVYRWIVSKAVDATIAKTANEDKSLQQQQLENEQKLAGVNKDLASLYEERKKLRDQYLSDAEKAEQWNKPPEQH